jgi:hypothetical protein
MINDAVPLIFLALFSLIHNFSLFRYLVARVINLKIHEQVTAALPWDSEWRQILHRAKKLKLQRQ